MSEGGEGVRRGGEAVRECHGPQRWLARSSKIQVHAEVVAQSVSILKGSLHEQVVRMLAIVQGETVGRLARPEKQWVAALAACGEGLGAQHRSGRELPSEKRVLCHQHHPVHARELRSAAVAPSLRVLSSKALSATC